MGYSSEREFIERARLGDNDAFEAIWREHRPRVASLCRRYLGGKQPDPAVDENDLVVDTFLRALHHLDGYEERPGAGLGCWLATVARTICLNHLAKQRRRLSCTAGWPAEYDLAETTPDALVETTVQSRELIRVVAHAVHGLPEPYRAAFKLHLEQYSNREIAGLVGVSETNAAKRVQRARTLLQPPLSALLGVAPRVARALLPTVEQSLSAIVTDVRIVTLTLPGGAEIQLCLRVRRDLAAREREIDALRQELRALPRAWRKRLEIAEICDHAGRWQEAREAYGEVLAIRPGCFPAVLRLGEMLLDEGAREEAAALYDAALERDPDAATRAALRAGSCLAREEYDAAATAFRAALALQPSERRHFLGLHQALRRLNRWEEQLENLARLREVHPTDLFGYVEAFAPFARLERFHEALEMLERAVALDPNDPVAIKQLFQVRMNLCRFDAQTVGLAERLVRQAPELAASWGSLSWILAEQGHDEESLAVLRRFLKDHPRNAEALALLAWRYHYLGRTREKMAAARRAYRLQPEDPYVCWTMLLACHRPEDEPPSLSERAFRRLAEAIVARFPSDAFLLENTGRAYRTWGLFEEAVRYSERAVRLAPGSPEARIELATIYADCGRWPDAAKVYAGLAQCPNTRRPLWLACYARARRELGDAAAEQTLATALVLAEERGGELERGRVYGIWGDRPAAAACFRRYAARSPIPALARQEVFRILAADDLAAAG